jgi:Fe-S-cluster containining protein
MPPRTERLNLSINTTSGEIHSQVDIPTGFIPITDIVSVVRSLSEKAQALEVSSTLQTGRKISCQKGCGACCQRIMVPVSPPEAFALAKMLEDLPQDHRGRVEQRLAETRERLQAAGLLPLLQELAESPDQKTDSDIDPINRAYYALRLPCIFLENDACSIYEYRPAACREYLVTTAAELCQDIEKNPVQELHIPLRAGTVLSILWAELTGGPVRLMPLPVAFEWADKHQTLNKKTWKGLDLFSTTLDGLRKFLHQTLASLPQKRPAR